VLRNAEQPQWFELKLGAGGMVTPHVWTGPPFLLSSDVSEIKFVFGIPPERPTPNIAPSWNLAPADLAPIVIMTPKTGPRRLEVMRWGLIPYWAKDIKIGCSIRPVFGWSDPAFSG
jgi:hypothetical protein